MAIRININIIIKFKIIAVLFSGGLSENTPPTYNIMKNPIMPIIITPIVARGINPRFSGLRKT
jgi:hypothetical protein